MTGRRLAMEARIRVQHSWVVRRLTIVARATLMGREREGDAGGGSGYGV